jgi:hypothetical protein
LHLHAARRSVDREHALTRLHEPLLTGPPCTDVLKARPSGPPELIGGRVILRGPPRRARRTARQLVSDQRPAIDQLVLIQLPRHARTLLLQPISRP